eukprot:g3545.t1
MQVHEIRLFEVILAHVEDNWYDYPAWSLAEIGAALAPIMPSARFENVYRQMLTQIRHDRDTLNLRGLTAAARFMAEVDHKGQFLPGFAEALAQRFMALKDESKERYDVARVTEIFAKRCPEDQALFSTLCRHLHRHLGIFEPVDFVRFTRGLAASEYRDQRVTHALPKWAQKRHQEFSPHDWDSFVTSLTKLGASDVRESQLREIGPPAPSEPATFSGEDLAALTPLQQGALTFVQETISSERPKAWPGSSESPSASQRRGRNGACCGDPHQPVGAALTAAPLTSITFTATSAPAEPSAEPSAAQPEPLAAPEPQPLAARGVAATGEAE